MATIGQQLTTPESGWRRYNDDDSRINYNTWSIKQTNASAYLGGNTCASSVVFKFYGTKFRIIGNSYQDVYHTGAINVTIDGVVVDSYSTYAPQLYQRLDFEQLNLSLGNHIVSLSIATGSDPNMDIFLDAIDIDSTGYLIHPKLTEKTSFDDMQIGDVIRFRYSSLSSGVMGAFSFADTITPNEIPPSSSATPDGVGYFIMVGYDSLGRKKLIADRNIQHSISWDTLNKEGIVSEKAQYFSVISPLKGNSDQGYMVSASSTYSTVQPYYAFDKNNINENTTGWVTNGLSYGKLAITLPQSKIVNAYSIHGQISTGALTVSEVLSRNPKNWTFEGSNDSGNTWFVLDTQNNFTNWGITNAEKRYFKFNNDKAYNQYRINITANNGSMYTAIGELDMHYIPKNYIAFIRLLTGGISTTDKDNEWDKIIAESDLGGKITPGDDSIWHWKSIYSWSSTTPTTGSSYRVCRGNNSSNTWMEGFGNTTYGAGTTYKAFDVGFRPVLLVESLPLYKYLIKQGSQYYSLKSEFYQNGAYTSLTLDGGDKPNDNDFKSNGFDNVSILTNIVGGQCVEEVTPSTLGNGEVFSFDIKDDFDSLINIS